MATDIIARGLGAGAAASAARANERLDHLSQGIAYRGAVDYYDDLAQLTPEEGDAYTVKYKGSSGTEPDGAEYVWGSYDGTMQWVLIGPDISQYQEKLVSGTNIKTINGASVLGSGDLHISTNHDFPASWPTTGTTAAFCSAVNSDTSAVAGMSYLGQVTWSDKPFGGNAEVFVEILPGAVSTKVIHLILSSGNIYPYRWEYTYWNGSSQKGWIGFQPTLDSTNAGANITILTDPATNVPTISAADEVFVVTYGSTTRTAILDAIAANSLPVMVYNGKIYITTQYTSSAVTLTNIMNGNGYIVTGTATYTSFSGATYVYQDQEVINEGKTLRVDSQGMLDLADWPIVLVTYGVSTYSDVAAAIGAGNFPVMVYNNKIYIGESSSSGAIIFRSGNYTVELGVGNTWGPSVIDNTYVKADLGVSEAGKFLVVGNDGVVAPTAVPSWQGGNY